MLDEPVEMPQRSVRDRVLLLRALSTVGAIDDEGLVILAEHARENRFRAGTTFMEEGEPTRAVHIVLDGLVRVSRHGEEVVMADRGGGIGFLTLLSRDPHGVTATAVEDSATLEIPGDVLLDAYEENFQLLRNSLRLAAAYIVRRRGNLPKDPTDEPEDVDIGTYRHTERTLVERLLMMRRGVFERCNLNAVVALARDTREVRVEEGTRLWEIGDPSTFWVRVDYGRIRCTADDGKSVCVGKDFILGVMDGIGQSPRSYSAVAETPLIVFRNERESFLAVMETHYDLAMDFQAILSGTLLNGRG